MDKLAIINHALMACGLPLSASLADCDWNASIAYPLIHGKMMTGYNWNFATRLKQLEEVENEVSFGYTHCYRLPRDFMRLIDCRRVFDLRAPAVQGRVMQRFYCSNSRPCNMRYIARVPEELWPDDFCLALSSGIAAHIAGLSAEKLGLVPTLTQLYQKNLLEAQAADASQCTERMPMDMTLWNVRQQAGRSE